MSLFPFRLFHIPPEMGGAHHHDVPDGPHKPFDNPREFFDEPRGPSDVPHKPFDEDFPPPPPPEF